MIHTNTASDRVSVIIPAYNRADDLPGVLETVLAQTHPVHEVLIVDDGSSDHTAEVARSLPGPVRYIHQDNQGVSGARNRGLEAASGDLVAFLDTDDRWEPQKLEAQLAMMQAHPEVGWSCTDLLLVDARGDPVPGRRGLADAVPVFRRERRTPEGWFSERLLRTRVRLGDHEFAGFVGDVSGLLLNGNFAFPSTALLRRSLVESVGEFDTTLRRAGDNDFFLRVGESSPMAFVSEPLTWYRVGAHDALTNPAHTVELTANAVIVLERAVERRGHLSELERREFHQTRRRVLLDLAYAHITSYDTRAARESLRELRRKEGRLGARGMGLLSAAHLPAVVLKGLARAKRALRRGG